MFEVLTYEQMAKRPGLTSSMFRHRGDQFVQRHGWPLPLDDRGHEIDAYDCKHTIYCLVQSSEQHLASARLRPARNSSMLEDHFPKLWERNSSVLTDSMEITRLCSSPHIDFVQRQMAIHELLAGLCNYLIRSGGGNIFGLVYPAVANRIKKSGWTHSIIDRDTISGREVYLCEWRPCHEVSWEIQDRLSDVEARRSRTEARVAA